MNTIELVFNAQDDNREILLAFLSDAGFEAFEETDRELRAYISEGLFDEHKINELSEKLNCSFKKNVVRPQNWNATWEAGFEPITVGSFCAVRAGFHPPSRSEEY